MKKLQKLGGIAALGADDREVLTRLAMLAALVASWAADLARGVIAARVAHGTP